jgi:phospholipid transport system substrate-binding protein
MERFWWTAVLLVALLLPGPASATDTARRALEERVDRVLEILRREAPDAEKKDGIRETVADFFDFEIMAGLALSYRWKEMDDAERSRFVPLYRRRLENVYLDRLMTYGDETVKLGAETRLAEDRVKIESEIVSGDRRIPLDYKLVRRGDRWRVYDLVIEGVSLARNYRSQFDAFLRDRSLEELMAKLREGSASAEE